MSTPVVYAATARVGRQNQLFSATTGARLVAGCVCLNKSQTEVLLVSSSANPGKWVLPKGGIETDETEDFSRAAQRETWEEAGVTGEIVRALPVVQDMRPPKDWPKGEVKDADYKVCPPRSEFHFFEMTVKKEHDVFPECQERRRRWFGYKEAVEELLGNKRPELAKAVEYSSIKK